MSFTSRVLLGILQDRRLVSSLHLFIQSLVYIPAHSRVIIQHTTMYSVALTAPALARACPWPSDQPRPFPEHVFTSRHFQELQAHALPLPVSLWNPRSSYWKILSETIVGALGLFMAGYWLPWFLALRPLGNPGTCLR